LSSCPLGILAPRLTSLTWCGAKEEKVTQNKSNQKMKQHKTFSTSCYKISKKAQGEILYMEHGNILLFEGLLSARFIV